MAMQIFDCEQNSPEWYAARAGIPTASMFATIMAKGRGGGESLTRKTYMHKLAGEILTGEPMVNHTNEHMRRGHTMEARARNAYAFIKDVDPQQVGFIRNGDVGASPDSLIGANGALEIKTKLPHLMIEVILRGDIPPEHKAQTQGQLWVAEREWIDFTAFWPSMKPFIVTAYRDDAYIKEIETAASAFNAELHEVVEKLRGYGSNARLAA
jgi:hypothetical protein